MIRPARFVVEKCDRVPEGSVVIRDLDAPGAASVTNDAENVVFSLWKGGYLGTTRAPKRLFYFDSEGFLDELLHDLGMFVGFAPGPDRKVLR